MSALGGGEKGEKEDGEPKEQRGNEWERLKLETKKTTAESILQT